MRPQNKDTQILALEGNRFSQAYSLFREPLLADPCQA